MHKVIKVVEAERATTFNKNEETQNDPFKIMAIKSIKFILIH